MNNLIPISSRTFHGKPTPAISAKDLCTFLCVSARFDMWISRRIKEYGFIDGEDYLTQKTNTAGRPRTDYYLSLDMAKELAMVERNDKGRQARRYFIDCEKELNQKQIKQVAVIEQAIPPTLQAILDQQTAVLTGQAHLTIRTKLMQLAREALKQPNPEEWLEKWSHQAHTTMLTNAETQGVLAFSNTLIDQLNELKTKLNTMGA